MAQKDPRKLRVCSIHVKLTSRLHGIWEQMHRIWVCGVQVQTKSKQFQFSKQSRKWMLKGRILKARLQTEQLELQGQSPSLNLILIFSWQHHMVTKITCSPFKGSKDSLCSLEFNVPEKIQVKKLSLVSTAVSVTLPKPLETALEQDLDRWFYFVGWEKLRSC